MTMAVRCSLVVCAAIISTAAPAQAAPNPHHKQTRSARPTPDEIVRLLRLHEGNVSAVARALGKDRALVNRWIRADGVDPESFRGE